MKKTNAIIPILLGILLVAILHSCKKSSDMPGQKNQPLPMEHGIIDGPIVTKLIGAEGGTLFSGDNMVRVDIPPGTVSSATSFSIQPVTKTLAAGAGKAYRLGPAGVNFQRDITLKFRYTEAELEGTNEDQFYLAYQDEEGYWHRVVKTAIDKQGKFLSAKTRHFSDWVIERLFYVQRSKYSVSAGEEVELKAVYSDMAGEDDLLAPLIPVPDKNVDGWFLNGEGSISNEKKSVSKYKAPALITEPQTVMTGVRIINMVSQRNPDRPGNSGLVIVQVPIELIPDEYFTWEFDGGSHVAMALDAALIGTNTIIGGTGLTGSVNITLNATKPGTYDMGSAVTPDNFGLMVLASAQQQVIYQGMYYVCGEPVPRYGKGKLTISQYGKVGEIIAGDLSATVYSGGTNCQNISRQITGKFRIRRKA